MVETLLKWYLKHCKGKGMYPIKVKASKDFIETFMSCEEASYDDATNREYMGESANPDHHTFKVLQRHKTVIEIRNEYELKDVYYRLGSGLISCDDGDRCRIRQATRIQRELTEVAKAQCPDTVRLWQINSPRLFGRG